MIAGHVDARPLGDDLLATKLAVPQARTGAIDRPELRAALTARETARVILVCAPTGYGKTMLLAAWCADQPHAVAWLSLAVSENDPALFTRYLIGALQSAGLDVGARAEALSRVPGANPIVLVHSLINDLALLGEPITLVLDDYHLIDEPLCHAALQALIDDAPAGLTVVIATRVDPPLRLGALRAAGGLAELRQSELRFTRPQAAELLVECDGLGLDAESIASLTARTEGWPAGLYLAALWLRGPTAEDTDPRRFTGDNRHIADYLSEVVLAGLREPLRDVLLGLSIADRFCQPLAEAIMDEALPGILESIERDNLFLVPLDQHRTWYRFHHLFGELLASELTRRHPERVRVLHRRAGAWYREQGLVAEAIEHITLAGDFDLAAELICEHWLAAVRAGRLATVLGWIQAFDVDRLPRYPELSVIAGLIVGVGGGLEADFRPWLHLAERGLAEFGRGPGRLAGTSSLRSGVDLLRSGFGYHDVGAAVVIAARMVRAESEVDGQFRLIALANLGFLLYLSGDLDGARRALAGAHRDPLSSQRPYGHILALAAAALVALDDGDRQAGERCARESLVYARAVGLLDNQVTGLAHVALGRALLAAGQWQAAWAELDQSVQIFRGGIMDAWHVYALLWAAPLCQRLGDDAAAFALVDEAETLVARFTDAGTLTALLADARRRMTLARRRRQVGPAELTEAELSVLRQLHSPRSQREIAQDLAVSLNTVKTHSRAIHRKLGVSTRADAVARARETGLL